MLSFASFFKKRTMDSSCPVCLVNAYFQYNLGIEFAWWPQGAEGGVDGVMDWQFVSVNHHDTCRRFDQGILGVVEKIFVRAQIFGPYNRVKIAWRVCPVALEGMVTLSCTSPRLERRV